MNQQTPQDLVFRMPAEWAPQEAVWLSWPHNQETWPGAFAPVPGIFAELATQIAEVQLVRINVSDPDMQQGVEKQLVKANCNLENVRFHLNATNDSWVRDHGPIYVINPTGQRAIINWGYNSWGEKYPPFNLDNDVPLRISAEFNERCFTPGMILEGGSIDVNGLGTLMTSKSCLLNPNRNPELSQAEIEKMLSLYLGVDHFLWLGDGIAGDDTDGHIDDITRFVGPNTVVTAIETNANDVNYRPLQENRALLNSMTDQYGNKLEVIEIPMPDPIYHDQHRLPASYANFLIINQKVLVPTYRSGKDAAALSILQNCFTDRTVVGIDCTDLVWGLGAIHCVTQQQPLGTPLAIKA